MINIGDTVRFIREKGGGIVKSIKGKIIYIETEDGFEIPFEEKDLVLVPSNNTSEKNHKNEINENIVTTKSNHNIDNTHNYIKDNDKLSVLLSFVAQNIENLSKSNFDSYIINDSNYHILYVYSFRSYDEIDKWNIISEGIIEPNQKLFIEELSHNIIADISHISVQILAFSMNMPYIKLEPISIEKKLDAKKFIKSNCFTSNVFFDDKSYNIYLVKDNISEKNKEIKKVDFNLAKTTVSNTIKKNKKGDKYQKNNTEELIEIDLHIDKLIESKYLNNLENKDMLSRQMEEFHNIMMKYSNDVGRKIIFIHGKGEGVLRSNIVKELKHKYKFAEYNDASFLEYGYGATLVTIHSKNFDNNKNKWK